MSVYDLTIDELREEVLTLREQVEALSKSAALRHEKCYKLTRKLNAIEKIISQPVERGAA